MKQFLKPGTNLIIRYIENEDENIVVKQLLDGDHVIYEQRLISSQLSEFTYDKMFYNELYEKETNNVNGFIEARIEVPRCVIQ